MPDQGGISLRRRLTPYRLLGPGILWLILFFVVPHVLHGPALARERDLPRSFQFDWHFSNYSDALSAYDTQFFRAFEYSAIATLPALLIAYPLAYAIAFRGGRWKNAMLLAVIAPFFTTYLIRTLAWETILSDDGFVVDTLQTLGLCLERRPRRWRPAGRDRGPHLQLPPLHDPADLRQPRADGHAPDRGGEGPLRLARHGVPEGDPAPLAARGRRRARC